MRTPGLRGKRAFKTKVKCAFIKNLYLLTHFFLSSHTVSFTSCELQARGSEEEFNAQNEAPILQLSFVG